MSKTDKSSRPPSFVHKILRGIHPNNKSKSSSSKDTSQNSSTSAPEKMATTSLVGKVAIVTGSSRSIGASVAKALGAQGATVVINYVGNLKAAQEVVDTIKGYGNGANAVPIQADVSTVEGGKYLVDETIKQFGRLDILILNSGIMGSKPINDVDEKFFDDHIQTNVRAPLFTVKHALPKITTPGGRIIFFSSSLTYATVVLPNALSYVASKGAIEQISRVLAKDIGSKGLTSNVVSPGPVDTPLFTTGKPPQVIEMISKQNPNNRLGVPDDIGPVVAFLASPAAQWINGQNIRVNGGFTV